MTLLVRLTLLTRESILLRPLLLSLCTRLMVLLALTQLMKCPVTALEGRSLRNLPWTLLLTLISMLVVALPLRRWQMKWVLLKLRLPYSLVTLVGRRLAKSAPMPLVLPRLTRSPIPLTHLLLTLTTACAQLSVTNYQLPLTFALSGRLVEQTFAWIAALGAHQTTCFLLADSSR